MRWNGGMIGRIGATVGVLFLASLAPGHARESIKIGVLKAAFCGDAFLAEQKRYFAAEGLDAHLTFFDAGQAVPVAIVSGNIDFGVVAPTGAFYSLAAQGALRIVAGNHRDVPGFKAQAIAVTPHAYDSGLKRYSDIAGHAFATSTVGSPSHYSLALLLEKYAVDLKSVRVLPFQSIPNALSAMLGGQADIAILPGTALLPSIQKGDLKLLGWVGDETPFQLGVVVTGARTADARRETVERFLRALRKGAKDYHDAFTDGREQRADQAGAPEAADIISRYVGQPAEQVAKSIAYIDPDLKLDEKDIRRQSAWFQAQGMVKGRVDINSLIDARYVVPLP